MINQSENQLKIYSEIQIGRELCNTILRDFRCILKQIHSDKNSVCKIKIDVQIRSFYQNYVFLTLSKIGLTSNFVLRDRLHSLLPRLL